MNAIVVLSILATSWGQIYFHSGVDQGCRVGSGPVSNIDDCEIACEDQWDAVQELFLDTLTVRRDGQQNMDLVVGNPATQYIGGSIEAYERRFWNWPSGCTFALIEGGQQFYSRCIFNERGEEVNYDKYSHGVTLCQPACPETHPDWKKPILSERASNHAETNLGECCVNSNNECLCPRHMYWNADVGACLKPGKR